MRQAEKRPKDGGGFRACSLEAAFAAFDEANSADPVKEKFEGNGFPKELLYARRMSEWLDNLYPAASPALRLAARCQHIERWKSPRSDYPEGRVGYLTWRRDLKNFHARRASEILQSLGFPEEIIERVAALIRKERLKSDPESQALEDVVCLVFLTSYLEDFAQSHRAEKVVDILRKTWSKMSETGRRSALELELSPAVSALIGEALGASET